MPLLDIFPEPDEMKLSALLVMMVMYGYVLCKASGVIGEGSEMLMLIFGPGIVGGLVIPILGAIPDCAVILISGMGKGSREEIQNELSVGVGTLVGSTIMLLTIPWGLGILLGRRDYDESTDAATTHKPKLTHFSLTTNCVTVMEDIPPTAKVMVAALAGYLVIQMPSFWYSHDADGGIEGERPWALSCMIFSMVCFVAYCIMQVRNSVTTESERRRQELLRHDQWKRKLDRSLGERHVAEMTFRMYDKDGSGYIEPSELSHAMAHMGLQVGRKDMKDLLESIDVGHHDDGDAGKSDGRISLREFQAATKMWVNAGQKGSNLQEMQRRNSVSQRGSTRDLHGKGGYGAIDAHSDDEESQHVQKRKGGGSKASSPSRASKGKKDESKSPQQAKGKEGKEGKGKGKDADEDDTGDDCHNEDMEEDEEQEEEYWELTDNELLVKASLLLLLGTLTVTIFSDPMVDIITQVGARINVSPFYIAFIVTPLASNSSEVYAGLLFAKKKTSESISMTMATLHGASTMNSTLALSIFMSLIYFRGLSWAYTAEVAAVILVVVIVGLQTMFRRTVFVWQGLMVLSLYPLSILFVWGMQALGME